MRWIRSPFLSIALLPLTACLTWKQIPVQQIATIVGPPDVVRVGTVDGRELRFTVTEVEPTALVGEDVRVEISQVEWLMRREFTTRKAFRKAGNVTLTVLAAAALIVVYGAILLASEPGTGSSGGGLRRG